jgi:hypothetical protein
MLKQKYENQTGKHVQWKKRGAKTSNSPPQMMISLPLYQMSFTNMNECVECCELYEETASPSDWMRCLGCQCWLHESYTRSDN